MKVANISVNSCKDKLKTVNAGHIAFLLLKTCRRCSEVMKRLILHLLNIFISFIKVID
jgi:hypothetical protein